MPNILRVQLSHHWLQRLPRGGEYKHDPSHVLFCNHPPFTMSATATGPDRPPLPVLTHVALPVVFTCMVLAIYPSAPARVATVLLLGAVYLYDATMYSGEDAGSAYWLGSALGPSWCGFVDMFLLARPVREWRFRTLDRPLGELPLLRRTYYVFCASQAARGIGWSY